MYSTYYSCHILIKLIFLKDILKNSQIMNFMTICPVGTKKFHMKSETAMI